MKIAHKTQQANAGGNGPVRGPNCGGSSGGHTSTETIPRLSQQGVAGKQLVAPQWPVLQGTPNYSQSAGSGLVLPSSEGQKSQMVPQNHQMLRQRQRQDKAQRSQVVNIGDFESTLAGKPSSFPTGLSPRSTEKMATPNISSTSLPGNPPFPNSLGHGVTGNSHSQLGYGNRHELNFRMQHKRQRLFLLHHSSKCLHEDGRCKVTTRCASMKRLWKHMARCAENNCRASHCFSSRSILSHYRNCKDPRCPVCGPVRETVKRSQVKAVNHQNGPELPQSISSGMDDNGGGYFIGSMGNKMNSGFDKLRQEPIKILPGSTVQLPQRQHWLHSMSSVLHFPNNTSSYLGSRERSRLSELDQGQKALRSPQSSNLQHMNKIMSPQVGPHQAPTLQSLGGVDGSTGLLKASLEGDPVSESSGQEKQQAPGNLNNKEQKSNIHHKQQRLFLLRHASKCPNENVQCKVTPYCGRMKQLWGHISFCRNQQCKVHHCMSSQSVLSHYRRCKDAQCPICGPVRMTITKIQEKDNTKKNEPTGSSEDFLESEQGESFSEQSPGLGLDYTGNILQEPLMSPNSGPHPSPKGLVKNVNNPRTVELPPQHLKHKRPKLDPSLTPPTPPSSITPEIPSPASSNTETVVSLEPRSSSGVPDRSAQAQVLFQ